MSFLTHVLPFLSLTNRDSDEMFSDTDYLTSPPLSKMFPSQTIDTSSQKLYLDETELRSDSSISKSWSKEVEAVAESPVRKISVHELEATADASCRKMAKDKVFDTPLETPSLKISKDELLIESTSRKISRDRGDVPVNVAVRKGLSNELDTDFPARKGDRDTIGDMMETASRNLYRERSDLSLDVRKILWNELEATTDMAPRKISRDKLGSSMDNLSRKMMRDDVERTLDSVSRRITRDSMGKSLDTSSRKLPWNKGESQLDSSVRALAMDKVVETTRTPQRKISRDELEYGTDIPEKQEFSLEPSSSRMTLKGELEMSAGSLRRRMPRMQRVDIDSSTESLTWDRVDGQMETPQQSILREELGESESSSSPGQTGQPDLMVTSQEPWKSSSDLYPLSQLVYDGILEKACNSSTPTSLSVSTPNLPQSRLLAEAEPPVPPPRIAVPSSASPREKNHDKEKSKKSLKLKNLFKKKNESAPEKLQSGLHKL